MSSIITRDDLPEDPEPGPVEPPKDDEGYAVGYGKPPLKSQFQPGNKRGKGRRKGSKNLATIVNIALGTKKSARLDGEVVRVSKMELAAHQLANKAAAGDLKAINTAISLYDRFGPQEGPEGPSLHQTKANLETLRDYLDLWDMFGGADEDKSNG